MKNFLNSKLSVAILTAIVFTGIGAYAESKISANKVTYIKEDGEEITVEAALNNLYTEASADIVSKLDLSAKASDSYGTKINSRTATINNLAAGTYMIFGNHIITGTRSDVQPGSSLTSAGLPTITVTHGDCTSLSQIRETANASTALTSSMYYWHTSYNRVWICTLSDTSNITVIGHASAGENTKNTSSSAIQVIKIK